MRQTIDIIRGTSKTINIAVATADGEPYVLGDNDILWFSVKRSCEDDTCVIKKALTSVHYDNGVYVLHLSPRDTMNLDIGRYYYDCGLQIVGEYYMVIEASQFNILRNVSSIYAGEEPTSVEPIVIPNGIEPISNSYIDGMFG